MREEGRGAGSDVLSVERLRVLLAVIETGSFSGAAERLGVSTSAVSQMVRRLEEELGRPLLRRSPRSVVATADGVAIAERARMIEAILAETTAAFSADAGRPAIRLGVTPDLAATLLPPVLAGLGAEADSPRLSLTTGSPVRLEARFARGELDGAVVRRPDEAVGGREMLLWREPVTWVSAPGAAWRQRGGAVPLVLLSDACRCRDIAMAALRGWNGTWTIEATASSLAGIWAAVRAGLGVTPLPASTLPADLVPLTGGELPALGEVAFVALSAGAREQAVMARIGAGLADAVRRAAEVVSK